MAETAKLVRPKKVRPSKKKLHEKKTEFITLLGFVVGMASWGYSVIAQEPNIGLGLSLFALCGLLIFIAVFRLFAWRWIGGTVWGAVCLGGFWAFAHYVVIKPLRGKEFKQLLVEGYQVVSECQVIPGEQQTPIWLRDQEERWRARVGAAVDGKLDYRYSQMWHEAIVYGLAKDENINGYRCAQMSVSMRALEQVIALKYDPSLPHQKYTGPMYVFQGQAQGAK
jgi:hypothetical protein